MIALGIAGALIYVASSQVLTKNGTINTALLAIGAVAAVKHVPVVNQYVA